MKFNGGKMGLLKMLGLKKKQPDQPVQQAQPTPTTEAPADTTPETPAM